MNTQKTKSRYAPTPSGFLHLGNAFNFLLVKKLVERKSGLIMLRIDDLDATRLRDEYLKDIFESLEWLGLDYQEGPSSIDEFHKKFSQSLKKEIYFKKMEQLESTFVCECSRSMIREISPEGIYPGTCRNKNLAFRPGQNIIRIRYSLDEALKDFIVWRKEDIPSYQLASVVDDIDSQINLIVRGDDLSSSSVAQKFLASQLSPDCFENIEIIHHPLLYGEDQKKLSKSLGSMSLKEMKRKDPSPSKIHDLFEKWFDTYENLFN